MKLLPRHDQVLGRIVIQRRTSTILRPDETKGTTKFVLIDALGPEAKASGLKVGDIVLPFQMKNIALDGGVNFRPVLDERDIRYIVRDLELSDLMIQTESGGDFVKHDSPDAAKSLGFES